MLHFDNFWRKMVTIPEQPLRQRFCQAASCGAIFFICAHCDRGQRYCSAVCRQQARRQQWRTASRRHQQTLEGKLDHQDRQRAYRQRKAASISNSVTHQGSQAESNLGTLSNFQSQKVISSILPRLLKPLFGFRLLICQFCAQMSRFVNPFDVPI